MDELIREVERNIRNSKELLKVAENRVAYEKNDLAAERVAKVQLEFYEGVHKELEYAKSHHELDEQLGCPFDVVIKALKQGFIYSNVFTDDDFIKWEVTHFEKDENLGWCLQNISGVEIRFKQNGYEEFSHLKSEAFLLKNYKITWWLKEDRSE